MPRPGVANNPGGVNNWQGFGDEQPYGEITNQKRLAGGAAMAGGQIAAGPLNAPKRATRNAKRQPRQTQAAAPAAPPELVAPVPPPSFDAQAVWRDIFATPGADEYPVLAMLAGRIK